jgi:fibronectin-binding autotransporter adhesin
MNKKIVFKKLFFLFAITLLFIFCIPNKTFSQITYTWNGSTSTAWETPANWTPSSGTSFPGTAVGDIVNIPAAGLQPAINATPANPLASLTFTGSGKTLTINSGFTLSVTGAVILNSSTVANVTGSITGAGGTLSCGSFSVGSGGGGTATRTTNFTLTLATITISGNLTLNSSFAAFANNSTFTHTSGTLTVGGSITTANPNAGNISSYLMGNTTPTLNLTGVTPFNISGTGTNTITLTGTGATVDYQYSAGNMTFLAAPAGLLSYRNLIISGGAGNTKTLAANFALSGTLTVRSATTLDLSTFTLGTPTSVTLETIGGGNGSSIIGSGLLTLGGNITVNNNAGGAITTGASISSPISLTATRTITIADDGTTNSDFTISGIISSTGAFGITKSGAGTLLLSSSNSYSGVTTVSVGTLLIGSSGDGTNSPLGTIVGATSITAGAMIDLNGFTLSTAEPITLRGTGISSGGALTNTGIDASYSGAITMGAAASVVVNLSGTLTLSGNCSGNFALTLDGSGNGTYSGIRSGTSTIVKQGTGNWTLSGSSTYTGLTTVSVGTLILGATGDATNTPLGTITAGTTVASGAVLDLNGFTLGTAEPLTINGTGISNSGPVENSSASAITYSGLLKLGSASSIFVNAGSMSFTNVGSITGATFLLTLGGTGIGSISSIIGNTTGGVTKQDSGTWTLSGSSTYTGATTVNGGTLAAGVITKAFGTGSNVTLANTAGVVLDLAGFSNTVGSLTGGGAIGGNITLGVAGAILTVGNATSPPEYAGIISGTGGLTKAGTGTLVLSGANTYTGLTTVNAGTLKLGATGDATNTPLGTTAAGTSVTTGATLDLAGFTLGTSEALTLNGTGIAAGGALMNSGGAATYSGLITLGSASSIVGGTGTIAISNTGTITGTAFLLTLSGAQGGNIASIIGTGTAGVTKAGAGTWTLSGSSTYTGVTTISVGTILLGASGDGTNTPLGTIGGATTIASGATLDLNGITLSTAEPITMSGIGVASAGALTNTGVDASYSGAITLAAATTIVANISGTLTLSGNCAGNFAWTLDGAGNGTYSGIRSGTGTLIKQGAGTWTMSGLNTYTGATTVNGGTLKGGVATKAFGTGSNITLANTAGVILDLGGFDNTIGSLTGGGATGGNVLLGANTLTLGNATSPPVYAGVISGSGGGLTKVGTGTLILSGLNTYTGLTTISAGTLQLGAAGDGTNTPIGTIAAGTIVSATNATLDLAGFTLSTSEALTLNGTGVAAGGALMNSGGAATYSGLITLGSASSIVGGTGTITVSNTGTITGATFALTLGGAQGGTMASIIGTTTGTLTKAGAGIWLLSGVNTYSGVTTISLGILQLGAAGDGTNTPLGTIVGATTIAAGGELDLNGFTLSTAEPITLRGTGVANGGSLTNTGGNASYSGALTVAATPTSIVANPSGTLTLTGNCAGNFALTLDGSGTGIYSGIRSGTVASTMVKTGTGTWTLSGVNTYAGGTSLNVGQLNINNLKAIGTGALTISSGTTIDNTSGAAIGPLTNNNLQTWNGDFTFVGSNDLNMGTGAITMGADVVLTCSTVGKTFSVKGVNNNGTRSLTKAGAGNLVFGNTAVTLTNFIITGGTLTSTSNTLSVAGDFLNSATFTHNSGTVIFNGTIAQTINSGGNSFNNFTVTNTNDTCTVITNDIGVITSFTTSANSVLDMGTNALSVNTVSHSGKLKTQNTTVAPITVSKTWGGIVWYNGSSPQTIVIGNYNNLIGSGGDRTLSTGGIIGVADTFTPGSGSYIVVNSTVDFNGTIAQSIPEFNFFNLTVSGNKGGGAMTLVNGGTIGVAAVFSIPATNTSYIVTGNTFDFNGTIAQSIPAFDFNSLTISGNKGGGAMTLVNGDTISVADVFSVTATNTSYIVTGNTFNYNGSGAQTVIGVFNYNNLVISNAGVKSILTGVTVNCQTVMFTGTAKLDILGTAQFNVLG